MLIESGKKFVLRTMILYVEVKYGFVRNCILFSIPCFWIFANNLYKSYRVEVIHKFLFCMYLHI